MDAEAKAKVAKVALDLSTRKNPPIEEVIKCVVSGDTMGKAKKTQCERLLEYLSSHKGITQIEALSELGILRLASRVHEVRSGGVGIEAEMIEVVNRFGEKCRVKKYSLKKK